MPAQHWRYTSIRLDSTRFICLQNVLFCAGLSSTENLLNRTLIRIILWAIAIFTLIGNSLVLLGRGILKDENKVPLNFIRSLAGSYSLFMTQNRLTICVLTDLFHLWPFLFDHLLVQPCVTALFSRRPVADMLMGFYLFAIAIQDLQYREVYRQYSHQWTSSLGCTFVGVVAMTSTEVLVHINDYIVQGWVPAGSIWRSATTDAHHRKRTEKIAFIILEMIVILFFSFFRFLCCF